jgi:hypothetical protein
MKQNKLSKNREQQLPPSANALASMMVAGLSQNEADFVPSPDEVARRAYFSYVNQGSRSGHEVQHWLDAEKHLLE